MTQSNCWIRWIIS